MTFDKDEVTIGRIQGNDIVLPKGNVSKRHSRIVVKDGKFVVVDLKSTNGTYVNGRRVTSPLVIGDADKVFIGDFILNVEKEREGEDLEPPPERKPPPPLPKKRQQKRTEVMPSRKSRGDPSSAPDLEDDEFGPRTVPLAKAKPPAPPPKGKAGKPPPEAAEFEHEVGEGEVLEEFPAPVKKNKRSRKVSEPPAAARPRRKSGMLSAIRELSLRVADDLGLRKMDAKKLSETDLQDEAERRAGDLADELEQTGGLPEGIDRAALVQEVVDETVGVGPLGSLIKDTSIQSIHVNRYDQIFVEEGGRLRAAGRAFSSEASLRLAIDRLLAMTGRSLHDAGPVIDVSLRDGSRLTAALPPAAPNSPSLTITKRSNGTRTLDDLVDDGECSMQMSSFLETCVISRRNILVSGGTGSAKSTTISAIAGVVPEEERIVSIDDTCEVWVPHDNWLRLEPRTGENPSGASALQLVRAAQQMRPDRMVLAEARGSETLDMLLAMAGGRDGAIVGVHAASPANALYRLETLARLGAGDTPVDAVRGIVASAVHVVVHCVRFNDGSCRITRICEVVGVEGGAIDTQDLLLYEQDGVDSGGKVTGKYKTAGAVPRFYEELKKRGVSVNMSIFRE